MINVADNWKLGCRVVLISRQNAPSDEVEVVSVSVRMWIGQDPHYLKEGYEKYVSWIIHFNKQKCKSVISIPNGGRLKGNIVNFIV